jgi:hypothetical protein
LTYFKTLPGDIPGNPDNLRSRDGQIPLAKTKDGIDQEMVEPVKAGDYREEIASNRPPTV